MMRALISDLGNVLLHFDHRLIGRRLKEHFPDARHDEASVQRFWKLVQDFESGAVGTKDFFTVVAELLGIPGALDEEKFRELWGDIFWPNTALLDILAQLRGKLTLVLLSNTNPLHIAFAKERFPEVFKNFHHCVFSYEIGCGKPDPRIFERALAAADVPPDDALYFDDIAAYVDAASALGIHAYQYVSLDSVLDVLKIYDFQVRIPDPNYEITDH